MSRPSHLLAAAAVVALVVALAIGVGGGTAGAGDSAGVVAVDPPETEVSAGETVEVDVTLRTDGGYADEGLYAYEYVVAHDPGVVTVAAVDHGPWLERGGGSVETTADVREGEVYVRHESSDRREGVTGYGVTATLTLDVAPDAPPSEVVIAIADADGTLVSDRPLATYPRNATLVVDGGGERIEPGDGADEGGGSSDGGVGITTPNGSDRDLNTNGSVDVPRPGDSGDGESDGEEARDGENASNGANGTDGSGAGGESVPLFGFGAITAVLAVVALLGVAGVRDR